jgi:hypothetical protein
MAHIELRSDNAAGVAPEILAAIVAANTGTTIAYGGDALTAHLQETVRTVFEHPGARVFPVTSGTAANALALSSMCPPWGAVLCHETAHILNSEAAATSMMGGGLLLRGVAGDDHRMQPATLADAFAATRWGDNHHSQPRVLSFTQPTDMGTIYRVDEVGALTSAAREHGLRAHLDGARIANAIVALGCRPADLTWRAGIDVVSLGATKPLHHVHAGVLDQAFFTAGPVDGPPVFLMHGFPYDIHAYADVVPLLVARAAASSCPACAASAPRASCARHTALGRAGRAGPRPAGADGRAAGRPRGAGRLRLGRPRAPAWWRRCGPSAAPAAELQQLQHPEHRAGDDTRHARERAQPVVPVLLPQRARPPRAGAGPARGVPPAVAHCGRPPGASTTPPSTAARPPSTTPTSSTW